MIWKTVPGLDNFEASDTGLIRERLPSSRGRNAPKQVHTVEGEPYVSLFIPGKGATLYNARDLICETWIGPRPSRGHVSVSLDPAGRSLRSHEVSWASPRALKNLRPDTLRGVALEMLAFEAEKGADSPELGKNFAAWCARLERVLASEQR